LTNGATNGSKKSGEHQGRTKQERETVGKNEIDFILSIPYYFPFQAETVETETTTEAGISDGRS
jgi:hypothetical protein